MLRVRRLARAGLLTAIVPACQLVVGLSDRSSGTPPAACVHNSDCSDGQVCLFQTCTDECEADRDCKVGERCLQTDKVKACASTLLAECTTRECPSGARCVDGACRSTCNPLLACLSDQVCESEACYGTDSHHDKQATSIPSEYGGTGAGGKAALGGSGGSANAGTGGRDCSGGCSFGGQSGTSGTAAGAGGEAGNPPTEGAFLSDGFEMGVVGKQPSGWDNYLAYVANGTNPNGTVGAVVDSSRAHSGAQSLHVHANTSPAFIARYLPDGVTKVYVRFYLYSTRQLGQNTSMTSSHSTLVALRRRADVYDDEIRVGEVKGTIGVVENPGDNVSPTAASWWLATGPMIPANEWVCLEVGFFADHLPNTLTLWQDTYPIFEVTGVGVDQWSAGATTKEDWLAKKFAGVPPKTAQLLLGWQTFDSANVDVDLWYDDVVLSETPVGCQ